MTAAEIKAELVLIKEAREAIYKTGTAYTRQGLSLTRANLNDLREQESYLLRKLAKVNSGPVIASDFSSISGSTESSDWGE